MHNYNVAPLLLKQTVKKLAMHTLMLGPVLCKQEMMIDIHETQWRRIRNLKTVT